MKRKLLFQEDVDKKEKVNWDIAIAPEIKQQEINQVQHTLKSKQDAFSGMKNWKIYLVLGEEEFDKYKNEEEITIDWPNYMNYSMNKVAIVYGSFILDKKIKDFEEIKQLIINYGDKNRIEEVEKLFNEGRFRG